MTAERKLLGLALITKILILILVIWHFGTDAYYTDSDANKFLYSGLNLVKHGVFSMSQVPFLKPTMFIPPGYSFFLLPFYGLFGNFWPLGVWLFQDLIIIFLAVLLFRELKNYTTERRAWWAALLFALEPYANLNANIVTPDSLFTAFLIGAVILFLRYQRSRKTHWLVWAAVALAIATLIKPISQFLPVLVVAYLLFSKGPWRLALKKALVFSAAFALILSPWLIRNWLTFRSLQVSSLPSYNLYFYNAAAVIAAQNKIGTAAAQELLLKRAATQTGHASLADYFEPDMSGYLRQEAINIIKPNLGLYLRIHALTLVPFFFNDGYQKIYPLFGIKLHNTQSITLLIARGQWHEVMDYVFGRGGLTAVLFSLGKVLWLIIYVGLFYNLISRWRNYSPTSKSMIITSLVIIIYFAILTGPVAAAPYRLPVQALIFSLLFI